MLNCNMPGKFSGGPSLTQWLAQIWEAIQNILTNGVKNPSKLTFTGNVEAEYDGSEPVTVEITGSGGGSSNVAWLPNVTPEGELSWTRSSTTTPPDPVNIKGPAGQDGSQGPQGPAGQDGARGPEGPAGKDGAQGPEGPAGAAAGFGTITASATSVSGQPTASVQATGPDTAKNLAFTFGIPSGGGGGGGGDVFLSGNNDFTGKNTFSQPIEIPDAVLSNEAVSLQQMEDELALIHQLPNITHVDSGKVLSVNASGVWEPSSDIPDDIDRLSEGLGIANEAIQQLENGTLHTMESTGTAGQIWQKGEGNSGSWQTLPEPTPGDPGTPAGFGTPTASAETLESGESATVEVSASGPDTAKVFSFIFGIPKGAQGPKGPAGKDGAQGPTGQDGARGPEGPAGKDGAQGPEGPAGAAAGFGTITASATSVSGQPTASVQATGPDTAKNLAFTFGIPSGGGGGGGVSLETYNKGMTLSVKDNTVTNSEVSIIKMANMCKLSAKVVIGTNTFDTITISNIPFDISNFKEEMCNGCVYLSIYAYGVKVAKTSSNSITISFFGFTPSVGNTGYIDVIFFC